MHKAIPFFLWISLCVSPEFGAQSLFDPQQSTWTLTNGWIRADFQLTPEGAFRTLSLSDLRSGDRWTASPNRPMTPIRFEAGPNVFDTARQYTLTSHYTRRHSAGRQGALRRSGPASLPVQHGDVVLTESTPSAGLEQVIVLEDLNRTAQITLVLSMYDEQPVLRYRLEFKNLTASTAYVTSLNMAPWTFADAGRPYTAMRVNQWWAGLHDFEPLETRLEPDGDAVEVYAGAHGEQCAWLALKGSAGRGLFAGWEFDGRSKTTVRHSATGASLEFASSILELNHPVEPGETFAAPGAFLGLFHGDFDEAAHRTHQFVNAVLAPRNTPDAKSFPYVSWDSWSYETGIDERSLRRSADLAAALGVELFVVDLGWARSIGDWYADSQKFPNGLKALSEYVHSLGMKFGLHFAPAEADPKSPVLEANPDWASSESNNYFGAASLCLAHQPAKEWVIQQAIRMIDDYGVDWILQDGENMVKKCTKSNHTHDPADSNYSNAVNGINAVVAAIQKARPNVLWENCEDGGNMMTFNMVKNYVTSITSDAGGALSSRRAAYGATYPFPPRYAGRYMPDSDGLSAYATNSYRFGGNWALMNRLTDLTAEQLAFLKQQVENYKSQRAEIGGSKIFHLSPPAVDATDAIQSYNPETGSALAVITRAESSDSSYLFLPKGLNEEQSYLVWFDFNPGTYSMSGAQLMRDGVRVALPATYSSEVVHIQPQ